MASYPHEPFAQADSLLTGLIDSYKNSRDAEDIADIQSLVENAVKVAQDRDFRVQDNIRELTQKVAHAEAEAVYSEARAHHEQRMKGITTVISGVQQDVQQLNTDLRGANDQQAVLQQRQKQLKESKQELAQLKAVAEPEKLKRISLYAHISGLVFDYATLDKPITQGTLSDTGNGEIRSVAIDHSAPPYTVANMLWDQMESAQ